VRVLHPSPILLETNLGAYFFLLMKNHLVSPRLCLIFFKQANKQSGHVTCCCGKTRPPEARTSKTTSRWHGMHVWSLCTEKTVHGLPVKLAGGQAPLFVMHQCHTDEKYCCYLPLFFSCLRFSGAFFTWSAKSLCVYVYIMLHIIITCTRVLRIKQKRDF
jgi:hypothetical protein